MLSPPNAFHHAPHIDEQALEAWYLSAAMSLSDFDDCWSKGFDVIWVSCRPKIIGEDDCFLASALYMYVCRYHRTWETELLLLLLQVVVCGGLWHLLLSMERPKGFLRRRDDAATVGKLLGSVTGKFGQAAVSSTAQETWLVQAPTAFSSAQHGRRSCLWWVNRLFSLYVFGKLWMSDHSIYIYTSQVFCSTLWLSIPQQFKFFLMN